MYPLTCHPSWTYLHLCWRAPCGSPSCCHWPRTGARPAPAATPVTRPSWWWWSVSLRSAGVTSAHHDSQFITMRPVSDPFHIISPTTSRRQRPVAEWPELSHLPANASGALSPWLCRAHNHPLTVTLTPTFTASQRILPISATVTR